MACLLTGPTTAPGPVVGVAAGVLDAEPSGWDLAAAQFRASTDGARGSALLAGLDLRPEAPGAQLALALVPEAVSSHTGRTFLESWLHQHRPSGSEAALALGRIGDTRAAPMLDRVFGDESRPWQERSAALAALCRLGLGPRRRDALEGALLAGTPFAPAEAVARFGLPSPQRQALERTMIFDSLRWRHERYADVFTDPESARILDRIDPDAPWPRLAEHVAELVTALAAPPPEGRRPR